MLNNCCFGWVPLQVAFFLATGVSETCYLQLRTLFMLVSYSYNLVLTEQL